MGKVAILDTSIDPGYLHCESFVSYDICRKEQKPDLFVKSHGTVCAMVFDRFAKNYDLISIPILADCKEVGKKPMGDIRHLKEGLALCLQLDADIVCLSAVSSILSDSGCLYPVVQKLSKKSIMVSALDNREYITIPTSYPFVVGVQSDWRDLLLPGELAYQKDDDFGAGLYANCDIALLKELRLPPSNSFAVPVAAAKIYQWMNQGKEIAKCIRQLKPYNNYKEENALLSNQSKSFHPALPLVLVHGRSSSKIYAVCRKTMDQFYQKYQVQSSALCSMEGEYDIRFRNIKSVGSIYRDLLFMEKHYKTDLIFIAVKTEEKHMVPDLIDIDIEAEVDDTKVCFSFDGKFRKEDISNMAAFIYEVLQ